MNRNLAVLSRTLSLTLSAALLTALYAPTSWAIDDVQVNFTSTVVAGTCQAELKTSGGALLTDGTLAFGDVYKSQVQQGNAWQNLCNGVTFGGAGDATGAAAEIYRDADGSGMLLNCSDTLSSAQTFDPNASADMPFSTRLVVAPGKTSADLHSGSFSAPVTFTVNYQ